MTESRHPTDAPLRVKRVLSNNAVVALDAEGHEVVALGRGLGHGRRPSDALELERVEQVFFAGGDAAAHRMTQFLAEVPLDCVRAAAAIADVAEQRLGIKVSQGLILPLADHLAFAVHRYREGMVLQAPLRWEVRHLYPAEYAAGQEAVAKANAMLGITLDPDEAVSLALHFVNAAFAGPGSSQGLNKAVQMTEIIAQVTGTIERVIGITVDQDSMSAARFVTHLRYLFTRVASGKQISDPQPTLLEAIGTSYPDAMACAQKVRFLIEMGLGASITPDETAYLAMHIARLAWDVRADDVPSTN